MTRGSGIISCQEYSKSCSKYSILGIIWNIIPKLHSRPSTAAGIIYSALNRQSTHLLIDKQPTRQSTLVHKKVQRFIRHFYSHEDFMQGVRKLPDSYFPLHSVQRVHHLDVQQLRAHGGRHPQPQLLQGVGRKEGNRQRNRGKSLGNLRMEKAAISAGAFKLLSCHQC